MLRRILLASSLALSLAACGGNGNTLPDGGTQQLGCTPDDLERHLAVRVVDAKGQPVEGAQVTAKNLATGKTITTTTNDEGITSAVGTNLGSGSVQLSAQKGTALTDLKQAEFQCGGCSCDIQPTSITLTLPN